MHTVIVGGGFAGVKAAREISRKQLGKITLISSEPYFLHHATLYATATGRDAGSSVMDLEDVFALHHDVDVVIDRMKSIDPARKLVVCDGKDIQYDNLILAIGSVTNYFGISGMKTYSYGIKTLEEVRKLRRHLHEEIVRNTHRKDAAYYVIGAGPTGVELAAAMAEYVRDVAAAHDVTRGKTEIILVEAAARVLPRMSKTASKKVKQRLESLGVKVVLNHKVNKLGKDGVTIDGSFAPTHTVVWTSGVKNHPFFAHHNDTFRIAPNGRVDVDRYLEAHESIYVIGDNANTPYSGRAYTALQDADFLADHLERLATKQPKLPYKPKNVASSVPVGHNWAYVEKYGVYALGKTGFWFRRMIELQGLKRMLSHNQAMSAWHAYDKSDGSCELCKDNG